MSTLEEYSLKYREIREFEKEFHSFLIFLNKEEKENTDTDYGLEKDEIELDKWKISNNKIKESIKELTIFFLKNNDLEALPILFHIIVKNLIDVKKELDNKYLPKISDLWKLYLTILDDIIRESENKYLHFIPYEQLLPITFDIISNQIAQENIDPSWIDINFWKRDVYDYISESKKNQILKFSLRSMINFIEFKSEQKKRLKKLKS